jgi:hypothetical protein
MLSMPLHRLLLGFMSKMTDPGSMSYDNMQQEGLTSCITSPQKICGNCFPCLDVCICQHSQQPTSTEFRTAKLFCNCHYHSFTDGEDRTQFICCYVVTTSIQQMLLGITAEQVTTLWLYWPIIVMHYTVNKYIDAPELIGDVSFNDYHSVVCQEVLLLLFQHF